MGLGQSSDNKMIGNWSISAPGWKGSIHIHEGSEEQHFEGQNWLTGNEISGVVHGFKAKKGKWGGKVVFDDLPDNDFMVVDGRYDEEIEGYRGAAKCTLKPDANNRDQSKSTWDLKKVIDEDNPMMGKWNFRSYDPQMINTKEGKFFEGSLEIEECEEEQEKEHQKFHFDGQDLEDKKVTGHLSDFEAKNGKWNGIVVFEQRDPEPEDEDHDEYFILEGTYDEESAKCDLEPGPENSHYTHSESWVLKKPRWKPELR